MLKGTGSGHQVCVCVCVRTCKTCCVMCVCVCVRLMYICPDFLSFHIHKEDWTPGATEIRVNDHWLWDVLHSTFLYTHTHTHTVGLGCTIDWCYKAPSHISLEVRPYTLISFYWISSTLTTVTQWNWCSYRPLHTHTHTDDACKNLQQNGRWDKLRAVK